ncbi:AAA family ATPase [Arthrobacter wenxiniae]|uniref:AAA family ATPase n=1 Tax=Arthrobacter wenxiniae TaxID=2713570 RepID=A0A7Y7LZA6_9MICC|nr:AAA family ATPase [Arthrobacter wenxiniae]NVM94764.1 AAA family ATPase [Arthrobacter wenxiniae]
MVDTRVLREAMNHPKTAPTAYTPPAAYAGTINPGAAKALAEECAAVQNAPEGTRNHTLNRAGFNLAQLVAGGELPGNLVVQELTAAARLAGLEDAEIKQTLSSALPAGAVQPRVIKPLADVNEWMNGWPATGTAPAPAPGTAGGEPVPDAGEEPASWAPQDLTAAINGTYKPLLPTIMPRTDGVFLLYPGKVHSLQGESESGKSMLMHAETARLLNAGQDVLIIDFEDTQTTAVNLQKQLGAKPENIAAHLHYISPECHPFGMTKELGAWESLLNNRYALVVIDGVTEAFAVFGVKSIDNDEVTKWGRAVPRVIARRTGAAVVVVDHVTKSADGRGRYAIGAQAKMSYLSGASYMVEVIAPLGVGLVGRLGLRVGKDRPGQVRPKAGAWSKTNRTQEIAVAVIDSTTPGHIDYTLEPQGEPMPPDDRDEETLTKVAELIEQAPKPPSLRTILDNVRGGRPRKIAAIALLAAEGYIRIQNGTNNSQTHHHLKKYP